MNSNLTMPNMLTPKEAAYRLEFSTYMRDEMEIPGFPRKIEIPDLHPNDAEARKEHVIEFRRRRTHYPKHRRH